MVYRHLSHGLFRASVYASSKHTTTYKLIQDLAIQNGVFEKGTLIEFSNALVNVDIKEIDFGTVKADLILRKRIVRPEKRFVPRGRHWLNKKSEMPNVGLSDNMVRFKNGTLNDFALNS